MLDSPPIQNIDPYGTGKFSLVEVVDADNMLSDKKLLDDDDDFERATPCSNIEIQNLGKNDNHFNVIIAKPDGRKTNQIYDLQNSMSSF